MDHRHLTTYLIAISRWEEVQVPCVSVELLHQGQPQGAHETSHWGQAIPLPTLPPEVPHVGTSQESHRMPLQATW